MTWYFTWVLGLGLAVGFGILNGIWHEFHLPNGKPDGQDE
jgi:cytochrome bd-I ubiquinol oxidase subunit X